VQYSRERSDAVAGIMSVEKAMVLQDSIKEAIRYIGFVRVALKRHKQATEEGYLYYQTREMGQVKRSAMDLSQVLVHVRR
jgi:hypothetical protein